jgi:hypothetical protein
MKKTRKTTRKMKRRKKMWRRDRARVLWRVYVRTCCSCFRLRVTIPDAPGDVAPAAAAAGVELVATRSPYVQPTGASLNTNTFL